MPSNVWDEIIYLFPNFKGTAVEVWEWISNFVSRFIMDVITYLLLDSSKFMWEKGVPVVSMGSARIESIA